MEIKIDVGETIIRRDRGHMGDAITGFIYLGLIIVGLLLALINPLIGAIPALFGIAGLKQILLLPVFLFMRKKVEFICTDKKLIIKSAGGKVEYYNLNEIETRFYCYMFQTKAFQRSLLGLGNGILIRESEKGNFNTVRMRIPMEKLGVQLLPVPSILEQKRIADFLDKQCSELDALIAIRVCK